MKNLNYLKSLERLINITKVMFCHDGPLKKDLDNNYYGVAHNNETFKRYYTLGEDLSAAIRVNGISKMENIEKLSKITVSPFEVIEVLNLSNFKGILFNQRKAKKQIAEAVKNNDYVVARLPSFIGQIAFDEAKKQNKICIVEVVACAWDAFWNHSIPGKLMAPMMYKATKKRVKQSEYTIYVTNNFLQNRYPTEGENISCSNVALTSFDSNVLIKRLEKIENMNFKDKIIIGTTAAVNVKYKGQSYIIKALAKLKNEGYTNYEYQLVGGGDQKYLKDLAKKYNVENQIKFMGAIKHKNIFQWLDTIDIYAQPSRQEGLPRALIEAMSRALPSIGANTAGIPELLHQEFIFSNTKKNIGEISSLLKSMNKKTMKDEAMANYQEAQNYDKELIEKKREIFFNMIKNTESNKP